MSASACRSDCFSQNLASLRLPGERLSSQKRNTQRKWAGQRRNEFCKNRPLIFLQKCNVSLFFPLDDLDAIVVFPAHPVTQGQPVTLRCRMRTELQPSVIYFYKDGKIIQNDTRGEFIIPAASKSDEGFYKCGRKSSTQWSPSRTSPESWMSVKGERGERRSQRRGLGGDSCGCSLQRPRRLGRCQPLRFPFG